MSEPETKQLCFMSCDADDVWKYRLKHPVGLFFLFYPDFYGAKFLVEDEATLTEWANGTGLVYWID
jgi:hypothetical protein